MYFGNDRLINLAEGVVVVIVFLLVGRSGSRRVSKVVALMERQPCSRTEQLVKN